MADRWHLLKNASEVLERLLQRHHRAIRAALWQSGDFVIGDVGRDVGAPEAEVVVHDTATIEAAAAGGEKQTLRHALFAEVKALQATGLNINQVRLRLRCHHTTAARFFGADACPPVERRRRCGGGRITAELAELARQRWAEGCRNSQQLFRELRAKGYRGSAQTLRRLTHGWRAPGVKIQALPKLPTAHSLMWLMRRRDEDLPEGQRRMIDRLWQVEPEVKTGYEMTEEFRQIVRGKEAAKLDDWLERAWGSGIKELTNFVVGLRRDVAAVRAALSYKWSQGPVEGHVNRLKLLKRSMYGRAKLDLLKARVCHAA